MKTKAILIVFAVMALVLIAGCAGRQGTGGSDTGTSGGQGTGGTGSQGTGDGTGSQLTDKQFNDEFSSAMGDFANTLDDVDDTNSDLGDFSTEDNNAPST